MRPAPSSRVYAREDALFARFKQYLNQKGCVSQTPPCLHYTFFFSGMKKVACEQCLFLLQNTSLFGHWRERTRRATWAAPGRTSCYRRTQSDPVHPPGQPALERTTVLQLIGPWPLSRCHWAFWWVGAAARRRTPGEDDRSKPRNLDVCGPVDFPQGALRGADLGLETSAA